MSDLESDSDCDELEKRVRRDHLALEERHDSNDNGDNEEIEIDPIVAEFGAENDEGIIQTVKSGGNFFFFVETAGPLEDDSESHFHKLGYQWQGVKCTPSRLDKDGNEVENIDDAATVFFELYIPPAMISEEEGAWALQKLYFPPAPPSEENVPVDTPKLAETVKAPPVDAAKLAEDLLAGAKLVKKSEKDKQEEKAEKESNLAEIVFKETDEYIPEREKVTLVLSDPIIPAIMGLLKKDRRLTPTSWRELKLKEYNLSEKQNKELSPMFSLTGSPQEEALYANLVPPLATALTSLLKKNVDYHLPTLKMYDMLWRYKSTNTSQYATKLTSLPEAQKLIDSLLKHMQHQVMTNGLLNYQLKRQIGNVMAGLAKDPVTSKVMQYKIQDNLDYNPSQSVLGHMTKTVTELDKTRKNLAKGFGYSLLGKRSSTEVSLTADKASKKPKLYTLTTKNRYNQGAGSQYQHHGGHSSDHGGHRGARGAPRGGARGGNWRGHHHNQGRGGHSDRGGQGGSGSGRGGGGGGRGRGSDRGGHSRGGRRGRY